MANNDNQAIKKWYIRDKHGNIKKEGSLAVVGEVHVDIEDKGEDEPSADSTYENGELNITFHDIKGDRGNGITSIETDEQTGDEAVNTVTIHTDDETTDASFQVRNGRRGNGIASIIEQRSEDDAGTNVITIHYTDPNVEDDVVYVKNGSKGTKGDSAIWDEEASLSVNMAHELGNSETKVMSQKGVTEGIEESKDAIISQKPKYDLDIQDENGHSIARIYKGDIVTKNFDSSLVPAIKGAAVEVDLQFSDEQNNPVMQLANGHVKTKNFDSSRINMQNLDESLRQRLSPTASVRNNLEGQRVAFLGDSITQRANATSQASTYHGVFCRLYGAIDRTAELIDLTGDYVLGKNATCIANNTKNNQGLNRFVTRATAENFGDSKLIVIFGGTNDFSYDSKPIGPLFIEESIEAEDNKGDKRLAAPTDTDAFAGALHELITTIQEECPLVPIVLMTPLHRGNLFNTQNPNYDTCNANGDYLIDFVNAIKEIGAFYSIPVLDLYSNANLNPLAPNGRTLFSDELHPNDTGHAIIGELLFRFVENNVIIK